MLTLDNANQGCSWEKGYVTMTKYTFNKKNTMKESFR